MNILKRYRINYIILLIICYSTSYYQNLAEKNILLENNFQTNNVFFNPNKFTYNHSIGFSTSKVNGLYQSSTILSNNIKYNVSEKLFIKSNVHLISPMQNQFNGNTVNILYDIDLGYNLSNSVNLNIKMTNYHPSYLGYHSIPK